jgi:Glycosyl transferase family 2
MSKPRVTAIIDTYNHERFIEEAIVSVLEQDFPASETEILVVDDGSTDRTSEIVRKFAPRVRLLRKANGGQASAFNAGIPEARAEIIAFLDGDDWWAPAKLTRVVEAMDQDPSVGIVGHGIIMINRDHSEQPEILREGFRFQANTMEGACLFRRRGSFLGTSRMTIRTGLLRRIGPVPEGIVVQADEYLFTLASALAGSRILSDPLTYYRLHDSNAFQLSSCDPSRMRQKQKALQVLAQSLAVELARHGIDPQVRHAIIQRIQADADQLRLMLDGGWPWETVTTEWNLYQVTHPDAPLSHRAFKSLILLAALATPPRSFYVIQRRLAQNGLYRRARKRWFPVPEMRHIERN